MYWSPVRTLPVAPLWCDLGFVPNNATASRRGNKAAANLCPSKVDYDLHRKEDRENESYEVSIKRS